jgi:hypothetical protein
LAVYRLDFIATIKTQEGEYKKILIEIQKAKNPVDLMRFRNYLAEQYKKEDVVNKRKTALPITTIYILGFPLPEIEEACLKIQREYYDLVNKKVIHTKSDFVEKLTHDCYVVQVTRIGSRYQTPLDKLLSLFEQKNFVDDSKIVKEYKHETDVEEMHIATQILHHSGTNPEEQKKIETEQEAWRTVDAMMGDLRQELIEKQQALAETNKALTEQKQALTEQKQALTEKDQALTEQKQALTEKDQALTEKDQALTEKDRIIAELMRKLNKPE